MRLISRTVGARFGGNTLKTFEIMEYGSLVDKTYVEYALKRTNAPIGVATYQLSNSLPENMKEMLPEPEEIVERLRIFEAETEFQ